MLFTCACIDMYLNNIHICIHMYTYASYTYATHTWNYVFLCVCVCVYAQALRFVPVPPLFADEGSNAACRWPLRSDSMFCIAGGKPHGAREFHSRH